MTRKKYSPFAALVLVLAVTGTAWSQDMAEYALILVLSSGERTESLLLDPEMEALKAGKGRRMTLGVPAGSTASVALKEAFRNRRPLGDLVLRAARDGAILIVSAADGPMPDPRDSTAHHFFTIEFKEGRVVSVLPRSPAGGIAMEAITIQYEGLERAD